VLFSEGSEWGVNDVYYSFGERAADPQTPEANQLRLYAKDKAGASALYYKNDAGVVIELAGGIAGSGVANTLAYWTSASALGNVAALTPGRVLFADANGLPTQDSDLTFATDTLSATKLLAATSVTVTALTLGSVLFAGTAGIISQSNTGLYYDTGHSKLLMGTSLASAHYGPGSKMQIDGSGDESFFTTASHISAAAFPAGLQVYRSRGTHAAPTTLVNGDDVAIFKALGYGTAYVDLAAIKLSLDGVPGANDMPGRISFWTSPDGSATLAERFRIGNVGQLGIGGATLLCGAL